MIRFLKYNVNAKHDIILWLMFKQFRMRSFSSSYIFFFKEEKIKVFFREIKFRGKFRENGNAIIGTYSMKADNSMHAQKIYSNKFEINCTHTHSVKIRMITWPKIFATLPKIFAINFEAGIKYVLMIKRGRTILGECVVAEVSRSVTAWNFVLLCSEFRCATLSNGQQRDSDLVHRLV